MVIIENEAENSEASLTFQSTEHRDIVHVDISRYKVQVLMEKNDQENYKRKR